MKKVLLLIISLLIMPIAVWAYQTVLVDFPQDEGWHPVFYQSQGSETILQYVPGGQTAQNWSRTLIFHSYDQDSTSSAAVLMDRATAQLERLNPTAAYRYTKYTEMDSLATRCVRKSGRMAAQCEIFRVSKSFERLISMQYIDKNVSRYKSNSRYWYQIVRNIRIYQSYYREDRIMDKATSFEL